MKGGGERSRERKCSALPYHGGGSQGRGNSAWVCCLVGPTDSFPESEAELGVEPDPLALFLPVETLKTNTVPRRISRTQGSGQAYV
jgi:hypothetical protein